jgi:hypothetical protein
MSFSPKVIQVLQKLIDQQLQGFSSDTEERILLIKCRQELNYYPKSDRNPLPLLYSRRKES